MAFEENKHPRDKNGQFTSKGSGASTGSTKTSTPEKKPSSNIAKKYFIEYNGQKKYFNNYNDARKELTRTKKNYESQINDLHKQGKDASELIDRYYDTKISSEDIKLDNYDEDYERSWGPANDEDIEKIEIDGDYERAVGPAPDPEEDPEEYKTYIKHYKQWLKNGESWDGLDGLKEDEEKERKQAYKLFDLEF